MSQPTLEHEAPLSRLEQDAWLWLGRLQGEPGDAVQMSCTGHNACRMFYSHAEHT